MVWWIAHDELQGASSHAGKPLPDPVCIAGHQQGHWFSHFHARAITLRALLEFAVVTADERSLEFVRRAYEYTRSLAIPRIGWVNCFPARLNKCEGCALGDLVALAIRLSDAGAGDYWDDVDAVVRNHLVEQQLTRADLLERVAAASPERKPDERSPHPRRETEENVIASSLGNFAGLSFPASIPKPWVMQCCTANGSRGLYYAWESAVRQDGDFARVNLLLNRAAPALDVDSYLPHEGKVVIHNKHLRRMAVRIPVWVQRNQLRTTVGGTPRAGLWVGHDLYLDDLKAGDQVQLEFSVRESTASYTIAAGLPQAEQTYRCAFRGSTLVDISPRPDDPTAYPLYQRDHLKTNQTPLKKTTRFVADKLVVNW